jgi:hypothetical protein
MFIQLIIALVCVSIAAAGKVYYQEGELALQEGIESVIKRPLTMLGASELPENFDPREKGWATIDLNQHIPTYCGSVSISHGSAFASFHIDLLLQLHQQRLLNDKSANFSPLTRHSSNI